MRRLAWCVGVAALVVSLTGCPSSDGSEGGGSGGGGGSGASDEPTKAVPGHISGRLADAQGDPLSDVVISIDGFPDEGNGEYGDEVTVDGEHDRYSIEVPAGTYNKPKARMPITYNGRDYLFQLGNPANSATRWEEAEDVEDGLVQDFLWRIEGPVPGGDDQDEGGYYGGTVKVVTDEDVPDGTVAAATFEPDGPLVDGSDGKTITREVTLPGHAAWELKMFDIPVGRYHVTVEVRDPSGTTEQWLVTSATSGVDEPYDPAPPAEEATVEFIDDEIIPSIHHLGVPDLIISRP